MRLASIRLVGLVLLALVLVLAGAAILGGTAMWLVGRGHQGSANPGTRGNVVLSGHNNLYGELLLRRLTAFAAAPQAPIIFLRHGRE